MPINQSMWKIDDEVRPLRTANLVSENELEEILQHHIDMLNEKWLVIGRQVLTASNGYIDLLAVDGNGSVIIIEIKKARTPREVIAQALDYASWVRYLKPEDIAEIHRRFSAAFQKNDDRSFDEAFFDKFGVLPDEDNLNASHQIVIVASSLDASTERIVTYLSDARVSVNVAFFTVFADGDRRYLSRAWFLDPMLVEDAATSGRGNEPWNGEYYVSFGDVDSRDWEDARTYGFISAGGGLWYSRTLSLLDIGDRVWVNIPQTGYVGVGRVSDRARKADEVLFEVDGEKRTIYEISENAGYHEQYMDDEENAEYVVRVDWVKAVEKDEAIREVGFFGNQNTVCRPTTPNWRISLVGPADWPSIS
ncbi:MAG: endonuclease NucS [Bacillota bacterium]